MANVFKPFAVLAISLITLNLSAFDINSLSDSELSRILLQNGVDKHVVVSLVEFRQREGWIWSYEDLLLAGVPEAMLPWFRYRFSIESSPPIEDVSPDLADLLIYPADLNTASPSLLRMLPGMNEKRLKDLLDYRKQRGFTTLRELVPLGWRVEEIRAIAPYVRISDVSKTLRWKNALRLENTNTLYRTTVYFPYGEGYLLLPDFHVTTGNLSTILTQGVLGGMCSSSWGMLVGGDFIYRQGMGLLFGDPFTIISREPSSMIVWEKGLRRPFSASRDNDRNHYDEIFRGLAGQISFGGWRWGILFFSNQTTTMGGFGTFEGEKGSIGAQGFLLTTNGTERLGSGSLFGRLRFPVFEGGGEWAFSGDQAWIVWMRFPGKIRQAMAMYEGGTNFFAPYGGKLYRGIPGRRGFVWGFEAKRDFFEFFARSEVYTNMTTGYSTFKFGASSAFVERVGASWVGMERIFSSVGMDIRTNTFFFSYGGGVAGWLFSPLKWEMRFSQDRYQQKSGSEYHIKLSGFFKNWSFSLWHGWFFPLKENPISFTFSPIESGEMESMWFYHSTETSCFLVRYRRKEMSVAARILTWDSALRFALSFQWEW
ncbi:helix-hairpin-helix domain-containing protein [Thermospira aquatica]|uniref:Helix-hairpin-helix domain-containing protein n=1 Tax=Thermospira aquatica TaxID=2828656 RepID=A0AAX3BFX2_9SPIR|nr:helix-hairpin-helix domain-containing protein [Thermospira aquatica]URA11033.1 helix-hairpin-helix domain-containing protein [Thermospira aquatica]